MSSIRPQSMVFTLYGEYVLDRADGVWVGSLVHIGTRFGLSGQAVRSALSRMVRNGWLAIHPLDRKSYYVLTDKSRLLLAEGSHRIFQRRTGLWDGSWHLLTYSIPEQQRQLRDQLRKRLSYLGFGPLGSATWISPHRLAGQVRHVVDSLGLAGCVELFTAGHLGYASDAAMAARCWDLDEIARRYRAFLVSQRPAFAALNRRLMAGEAIEDSQCFVDRFLLVHEYRRFFFLDPELPRDLLPPDWPGWEAAQLFQTYHDLLAEPANRYFETVLRVTDRARERGRDRATERQG